MPQVVLSRGARADLQRLQKFLKPVDPAAAERVAYSILKSLRVLEQSPESGRPAEGMPVEFREWIIRFGSSGYVALYRFDKEQKKATVLAIRHQKESGF